VDSVNPEGADEGPAKWAGFVDEKLMNKGEKRLSVAAQNCRESSWRSRNGRASFDLD
jgi:hypothetical protein